ncbi:terminase [Kineococcus esterisolvens]|uniref:terminase n=1 Tax=unclassified Kineococcus TaxID=2621656 RepID=UPI003D7E4477
MSAAEKLTAEDIEALEPTCIGPTWKRDENGWHLPAKTLGWEIAGWCTKYLAAEGGGPWKFTMEQLRFVLWWYALDDQGQFAYRTGVLQRMKGWGKDPLLAVLCLVELVGPSRFGGWKKDGSPIGRSHPAAWVQVTAVNQSQTSNTMSLIPSLMTELLINTYDIKPGAELIRAKGGRCRLEAVTSSYRALEGKRTTFTLLNETHHWVSGNNGHKMFETIDGNATKMNSRYLAITNAYLPGEDSVAERMRESYNAIVEGKAVDIGFLYDSLEAHPLTPLTPEALEIVLPKVRGDAVWLNVRAIIQSVQSTTIAPSRSRRMYLNQIVAEEDALYGPEQWDPIAEPGAMLRPGDEITLGFDGGKTDDATALVAIRVSDATAFLLHIEEKPDGPQGEGWQVNQDRVNSAVHEAFRLYDVKGFYADVALWESWITEWAETYGEGLAVKAEGRYGGIGWDMRQSLQRVTRAHERLMQAVFDRKVHHDGDLTLRRHALNARRRSNNYGLSFGKESRESPRKVDAYAALMLAHEALHDLKTRGKKTRKRTGRGYFL